MAAANPTPGHAVAGAVIGAGFASLLAYSDVRRGKAGLIPTKGDKGVYIGAAAILGGIVGFVIGEGF